MNKPLDKQPTPDQQAALGRLGNLFGGGNKKKPYMPIMESLETIGLEPKIMMVMVGEEPIQCLVIPTADMVYKEWQYMTGSKFEAKPLGEEQDVQ